MERFTRTLRGYDPVEVNNFLDQVIGHVEKMIASMKEKDQVIATLKDQNEKYVAIIKKTAKDRERIAQYEKMDNSLNSAITMAQKTSDQIKANANRESQIIIENAKKNANRIVNEALMKAEKSELEAERLKRDLNIFKRKMRDMLETQLELVDDMNVDM